MIWWCMQKKMDNVWDNVWEGRNVISDYSLKLYDLLGKVSKKLKKNSKILEVGCGSGEGLAVFKDHETYGVDISKKALELSKRYTKNVFEADASKLPFEDNYFDFVFSSGLLEHFDDEKAGKIIREMTIVSKKSGKVLILVPNSHCLWYKAYKFITQKRGTWEFGYERDFSLSELKKLSLKNGLKIEKSLGLQVLLPTATNRKEIFSEKFRRRFIILEKVFPFKQYYAYVTAVIGTKTNE